MLTTGEQTASQDSLQVTDSLDESWDSHDRCECVRCPVADHTPPQWVEESTSLRRRPSNCWISIPFNMFVFDLMFYTPLECIGTINKLLPLASPVSRAVFKLSVLGIWGQSWRTTSFEFQTCWPTTEGYDKREVLTLQSHVCAGPLQSTDVLFF